MNSVWIQTVYFLLAFSNICKSRASCSNGLRYTQHAAVLGDSISVAFDCKSAGLFGPTQAYLADSFET